MLGLFRCTERQLARGLPAELLCLTAAFSLAGSAFAQSHSFTPTSTGTFDANIGANWIGGAPPSNTGTDVNFVQSLASGVGQSVTNLFGSINYLRLQTTSSGTLTVISSSFDDTFGFDLHTNDTLLLSGNTTVSHGSGFIDDAGGTLIVSNGANVIAALGFNGGNKGTLSFVSLAGQTGTFNFRSGSAFNNGTLGSMIMNGSGTGVFQGSTVAGSDNFINNGTITVNGGTLVMDTGSATTQAGFSNAVAGVIRVNNGSTFLIGRSAGNSSGWDANDAVTLGTILLAGGANLGALRNGSTFTGSQGNGSLRNYGTISGFGTISAPLFDNGSGRFIANGGTLTVAGNMYGSTASWIATNVGAQANVLQFVDAGFNNDLHAATVVNTNGTIQVGSGVGVILPNVFARNSGTLLLSGGSFQYGNASGQQTFTNAGTGVIAGQGTFLTESGVSSYTLINNGTILANNGSLFIRTGNATLNGGFSNSASGTIVITNGATLGIMKHATSGNWDGGDLPIFGNVVLSNGTLKIFTSTDFSTWIENFGQSGTNGSVNVKGTVTGWGTITAPLFEPAGNGAKFIANNGTLTIGQVYGGQTSVGGDTWIATNVGARVNVLSFNGGAQGFSDLSAASALINSNGTVEVKSGVLTFPTNSFYRNDGTLLFGGGSMGYRNVSTLQRFTNSATGVIQGVGTLQTGYGVGQNNYSIRNQGLIVATGGGTLYLDPNDAQTDGGFLNTGTVQVNVGTTFVLNRSSNQWNSAAALPTNNGTIYLNGGTFTVGYSASQASDRPIVNNTTIIGNGTLAATVIQGATGSTIGSNGILNVLVGPFGGGPATFTTGAGTFAADLNGDLRLLGNVGPATAATWVVRSGGSIEAAVSGNSTGRFSSLGGTLLFQGGTFIAVANAANLMAFTNAGTVAVASGNGALVTGAGGGNDYSTLNLGSILVTNGTLITRSAAAVDLGGFQNGTSGIIQINTNSSLAIDRFGLQAGDAWNTGNLPTNRGTVFMNGGTLSMTDVGSSLTGFAMVNTGTLQGNGVINAALKNSGSIIANSGTLTLFSTNASNVGAPLVQLGTLQANAAGTLLVSNNNGLVAFANSGTIIANGGTIIAGTITNKNTITGTGTLGGGGVVNLSNIFVNAGNTLTFSNYTGSQFSIFNQSNIVMNGGSLVAGTVITNAGSITGFGTVAGAGVNDGPGAFVFALTNGANTGTLTVQLNSFTNLSGATVGTIGTNAVLNLVLPGSTNLLVNNGTISISGGSILFNNGTGTIINFNTIAGVGTVTNLPIVNQVGASFVAQNPVPGLSNLIAGISGVTNSGVLGGKNGATLTLTVGGGGTTGLVNQGTINLQGGYISFNGGQGSVSNISGGIIYGAASTESNLNIVNLSGGSVVASNGTLRFGMINNLNQGLLSNFNATATLLLTNSILVNASGARIALNGGALGMGGSVITNQGVITGPGNEASSIHNDTNGTVIATNGTLAIATNGAVESVNNLGTFSVAAASTLNVVPDWNNTNGLVNLAGGSLTGGAVTNKGTISGSGTVTSSAFVNTASGMVTLSSGGTLNILSTTAALNGTMIAGTSQSVVMTNLTSMVNNGTMILNGAASDANTAFFILRNGGGGDFTNAVGGVIRGAGYFATGVSGGTSFTDYNLGSILATNGALILQPFHAFGNGGFVNLAGGTVTVTSASTFGIQRNDDAWASSGTVPINAGLIRVNGGSVTFYGDGLNIANDRAWSNAPSGVISGFGTLLSSVNNLGTMAATNGNLTINNASAITQNGTIAIAANATLTVLGAAGSFQNNTGAQMLLAGGTFAGTNFAVFKNQGTISGFGTIQTGRLTGSAGANQNMVNFGGGAIVATNGTLFLNPGDAFADGGFSNSSAGAIIIANNGTLALNRTANAWNNYGIFGNATNSNPKNRGTINLQGGSFVLYAEGLADASRFIDNVDGTIGGFGTISGSISNLGAGTIRATGGTLALQGTGKMLQAGTLQVDGGATLLISNINGLASISNAGTILMDGGTLLAGAVTNAANGWIKGAGTISNAFIVNTGTIFANSSSPLVLAGSSLANSGVVNAQMANLIVKGSFNNSGTFASINSVGTFNGAVVNSGAWITDPTTNVFQNAYTVTSSGYVQMTSGDVFVFSNGASTAASFVNLSSKSNQYDTLNGKFLFDNTLGLTQTLVVAGHDLGPGVGLATPPNATNAVQFGQPNDPIFGYSNNFAIGTLEISDFTTVRVTDAFMGLPGLGTNDGLMAGLYLENLIMGQSSFLIISTNVEVYFKSSNTWTTANFLLEGNPTYDNTFNGLHQLVVVPEPGVALLWLAGFLTIYAARRRATQANR